LLETGVGRLHNVALASLANFSLPGDVSASERYYDEDLIDPPVAVTPRGTIRVPDGPGIGHEVVMARLSKFSVRRETLVS
jgi:O-succinylbenzoate synthase